MNSCEIKLNTLEKVKNFVSVMSKESGSFKLVCGKYSVDATSVLGILSLDLTRPLLLTGKDTETCVPEQVIAAFAV